MIATAAPPRLTTAPSRRTPGFALPIHPCIDRAAPTRTRTREPSIARQRRGRATAEGSAAAAAAIGATPTGALRS